MDAESFAKSKAKIDLSPVTNTDFSDVAGCDSAKIELEEVCLITIFFQYTS